MLPWHSYVQMLPSGIDFHVKDGSFFYFVHYIMHSTNAWEYVPVRVQDIRLHGYDNLCVNCYLWFVPVGANGRARTYNSRSYLKRLNLTLNLSLKKKSRGENDVVQHLMAYSRQGVININNVCWYWNKMKYFTCSYDNLVFQSGKLSKSKSI